MSNCEHTNIMSTGAPRSYTEVTSNKDQSGLGSPVSIVNRGDLINN